MEVTSKDQLKNLSLQELKIISKGMGLGVSGTKTQLINNIWDFSKPQPILVNTHNESLTAPGRKMVGIKNGEADKYRQMGSQVEKGNAKLIYYSMGVHYFEVNKDFNFV
jgi:hypothetical protein